MGVNLKKETFNLFYALQKILLGVLNIHTYICRTVTVSMNKLWIIFVSAVLIFLIYSVEIPFDYQGLIGKISSSDKVQAIKNLLNKINADVDTETTMNSGKNGENFSKVAYHTVSPRVRPIILAWNRFFAWSIFDFHEFKYGSKKCTFDCEFTEDKKFVNSASVVIFHTGHQLGDPLPEHRRPSQLYAMLTHESPVLTSPNIANLPNNYFNISITYHRNSTIFVPYGAFSPITAQTLPTEIWSEEEIRQRVALKKRLAVQFVSHCNAHSGRDALTRQLGTLIELDMFGHCDGKSCDGQCYQRELASHFFYLAFENSVCPHYVTEKFWKALRNLAVPIVLSRKMMEEAAIGADDAYIAADDFDDAQGLADYLKTLQRDTDKYLGYFNWTKKYQKQWVPNFQSPLCRLCELAHKQMQRDGQFRNSSKTHTVPLDQFWQEKHCERDFVQNVLFKPKANGRKRKSENISEALPTF